MKRNNQKDARYHALPKISPYTTYRYDNIKEDHKFLKNEMDLLLNKSDIIRVADIGCGNGELLYFLGQQYPEIKFHGFDYTPEFIEFANKHVTLKNTEFVCGDLFELNLEDFDLVISDGVTQIFDNVFSVLNKKISILHKGGILLTTGRFNKFDIEVRMQYCDNSKSETKGLWRSDWCQHSRKSIYDYYGDKVESIEFKDMNFNLDLECDEKNPINQFTINTGDENRVITNGTNVILNKTLLKIVK